MVFCIVLKDEKDLLIDIISEKIDINKEKELDKVNNRIIYKVGIKNLIILNLY